MDLNEPTPNEQQDQNELTDPVQPTPTKVEKRKTIILWILGISLVAIIAAFFYYQHSVEQRITAAGMLNTDSIAETPNNLASMQDYEQWQRTTFVIPQYDRIPIHFRRAIVKIFMDNGYYNADDTPNYFLTKIADRAKDVYAFGNFTGGGGEEMAVILEKQDFESSALFIVSANGDLLFWKELSSQLPTIKMFRKNELIYKDEMVLKPAALDGIMATYKGTKNAYIYNQAAKSFASYYQYTAEDLRSTDHGFEGDGFEGAIDSAREADPVVTAPQ